MAREGRIAYSARGAAATRRRRRRARAAAYLGRGEGFALLLALPALLLVVGLTAYPWAYSFWLSLHRYNAAIPGRSPFVGLGNYAAFLADPTFRAALGHTAEFSALALLGSILIGLGMALVLNEPFFGRGVVRAALVVPWTMSFVMVGITWRWLFDERGPLSAVLAGLGLIPPDYSFMAAGGGTLALSILALAFVWNQAPVAALLFLAALQAVPPNLYRAARVDGATAGSRFLHITLPWLRPTFFLVTILITINALMTFELVYVMTGGGPGSATTIWAFLGYQVSFAYLKFGEGTALLYSLSLICLALALLYLRLARAGERAGGSAAAGSVPPPALGGRVRLAREGRRMRPVAGHAGPLAGRLGRWGGRARRGALLALAGLVLLWSVGPPIWLFAVSLAATDGSAGPAPAGLLPRVSPHNYALVLAGVINGEGRIGPGLDARSIRAGLVNSLLVGAVVTLIGVVVGSLAGYATARFQRLVRVRAVLQVLLITRMIPPLAIVVPWFVMLRTADLLDTRLALVVVYLSLVVPLTVWITKSFFESVPDSLERAAWLDGCGRLRTLVSVVLPVARPGLAAAAIFAFVSAWNELLFALMLTHSERAQTIQVVILGLSGGGRGALAPVLALSIIPPLALTLLFQRHLRGGLLAGSLNR